MRVTITVEDKAMKELLEITDSKKKSKAILKAIDSFLSHHKLDLLVHLRGKLKLENNLGKLKEMELKKLAKLGRIG